MPVHCGPGGSLSPPGRARRAHWPDGGPFGSQPVAAAPPRGPGRAARAAVVLAAVVRRLLDRRHVADVKDLALWRRRPAGPEALGRARAYVGRARPAGSNRAA